MRIKRLITIVTFSLFIYQGLAFADTKPISEPDLDGVWELVSYELPAHSLKVAGQMLIKDEYFAIDFDLQAPGSTPSARSHAGTFYFEGEKMIFNVKWWVEIVDGVARIVEPQLHTTRFKFKDPDLNLFFGSGGVQHWHRIQR